MRAATFSKLIDSRFVCNYTRRGFISSQDGGRKEEGGVEEDDGSGRERKPAGKKEKRNGNEEEPVILIPFKTLLTREYPMCIRVEASFFIFRPSI